MADRDEYDVIAEQLANRYPETIGFAERDIAKAFRQAQAAKSCLTCAHFSPKQRPHVERPEGWCCHKLGPIDFDGNNAIVSADFSCALYQAAGTERTDRP